MTVNVLPAIPAAGLTHAICTTGVALTVRAMVVVADRVPEAVPVEVPWMVIVAAPVVAVLLAVSVRRLLPVAGLVANAAVTPLGIPDAVRVTGPLNPPTSTTLIVSVPPAFRPIVNECDEGVSVKLPPVPVTVSAMVVVEVSVPDVQVMVMGYVPIAAVLLTATVSTLVVVIGLIENAGATPTGWPDTEHVTLPANGLTSVTVKVSVPLAPGAITREGAEGVIVKLPPVVTVSVMVMVLLRPPEAAVMVTVDAPTVAVVLAANVNTLVVVAGLMEAEPLTPLGRPVALRVTWPANGLMSVIEMVTLQLPPWGIVQLVVDGAIVKLPVDGTTVRAMVVVAVVEPEVPVMVTVEVPTVAVALAVNVITLVPVVGLAPKVAVTPAGRPVAAKVTLPVNPPTSVTVMVSVAVFA